MYLSPAEITSGRQHSLNNFQTATAACVSASERLTELFTRLGRQQLQMLSSQPQSPMSSGQWLSGLQSQSAVLLGELLEIIGDAQQTVIITAATQTRVLDQLLVTALERARASSPVEVLPALTTLKESIQQTEQGLTGWADAVRQTIALLEARFAQLANLAAEQVQASTASLQQTSEKSSAALQ